MVMSSPAVAGRDGKTARPVPWPWLFLLSGALLGAWGLRTVMGPASPSRPAAMTGTPVPRGTAVREEVFEARRRFEQGLDALESRETALALLAFGEVARRGEEPWRSRARVRLWQVDETALGPSDVEGIVRASLKSAEKGILAWRVIAGGASLNHRRYLCCLEAVQDGRALDLLRQWAGPWAAQKVIRFVESPWLGQTAPRDEVMRDLLLRSYRRLVELPLPTDEARRKELVAVKSEATARILKGLAWHDNRLPISQEGFTRWMEDNLPPHAPRLAELKMKVFSVISRRRAFGGENEGE